MTVKTIAIDQDYLIYEAEKRAWINANPGATPAQYEAAMRSIAKRLGI